jgi:hypothetical protein
LLAVPFTAVDGTALYRMLNRAFHAQTLPRSPTRREFSIINLRLHRSKEATKAKVYKFNNRKDDAVFSKDKFEGVFIGGYCGRHSGRSQPNHLNEIEFLNTTWWEQRQAGWRQMPFSWLN